MTEPLIFMLTYLLGAITGLVLGFALFHETPPPRPKE